MIRAFDAREVRGAGAPLLATGVPLMERASNALAPAVLRYLSGFCDRRAFALVGRRNSGGDALFAVAFLARWGMGVVAVVAEGTHGAGLAAARAIGCTVLDVVDIDAIVWGTARAGVWIDGILGIEARGGLHGPFASLVERLKGSREGSAPPPGAGRPVGAGPLVTAVDVPFGVETDDGVALGPILHADLTVTMGAPKLSFLLDPARRHVGHIETADIGLCLSATARATGCAVLNIANIDSGLSNPNLVSTERADFPLLWPVPGSSSHKYTRGVVGTAIGPASHPGTGFLCVDAVLAARPGMAHYAETLGSAVVSSCPEAVLGEGRVGAWVIGPGLDREALAHAESITGGLRSEGQTVPIVLDADAPTWAECGMTPATVLTPYTRELTMLFSRLGIEGSHEGITACSAAVAKLASEFTGVTVTFRGLVDVIVSLRSPVYAQPGPAWRAIAGAGGVYAGLLSVPLTAGLEPARVMAAAACVHGLASENGSMRASDTVWDVPAVARIALAGGGSEEGSDLYVPGASASAFHMRRARVGEGRRGARCTGGAWRRGSA